MQIMELLTYAVKQNASDLHLSAGLPPMIRVDGDLHRIDHPALENRAVLNLMFDIMTASQQQRYETAFEADFSFEIPELARFRANIFKQDRGAGGAFRTIPPHILTLEDLSLPAILKEIADLPRGLVLVTGPTGSGKTTTLAAMLNHINTHKHRHIITIEDPIEFIYESHHCLINQREVGRDTHSFNSALRSALREDPDIILVGEMRDLETIRLALTAAETGHLVFASLHTTSAAKTINRIIDVFPAEDKAMVRSMLSESLQAVIAQTLIKKIGSGRTAAVEIMLCNPAIRNLIREDKVAQMYSTIQINQSSGMQTLDQHLMELVTNQIIHRESALEIATNKEYF